MPLTYGVPALIVDNLLYNLSVVFFVLSGACVMLLSYHLPTPVYTVLIVIAIAAAMGILAAVLAAKRRVMSFRKQKTPEERREQQISKGIVSLFSGVGLTVFLYYLSAALVLKLPPNVIAQIPFELDPVIRVIWLFGLIPTLTGFGHILAGLMIRPHRHQLPPEPESSRPDQIEFPKQTVNTTSAIHSVPGSVTEHTTNLLEEKSVQ